MNRLFSKRITLLLCAALALSVLVPLLNSSRMIGVAKSVKFSDFSEGPVNVYRTFLPKKMHLRKARFLLPGDSPQLFENGVPLKLAENARMDGDLTGKGEFQVTSNSIYFTTTDGTSPLKNGRSYIVKQSTVRLPAWLLLSLWGVAAAIWVYLGYCLVTVVVKSPALRTSWGWLASFFSGLAAMVRGGQMGLRKCFRTPWLHFVVLGIATGLVFYGTHGKFPIQGDCVVAIDPAYSLRDMLRHGLVDNLQCRRLLPTSQNVTYHLLGDSFTAASFLYIGVFLASVLTWYGILRSLFGATPALLGALFFLCYSGKYETVTWFAAGMYTIVMFAAVLILGLTRMRINPWLRLALIILLLWLSLPFYEVLVMMIPVFFILYLGPCVFEKRKPTVTELALSFGPILPVLIHVAVLACNPNPIWNRSAGDPDYQYPVYEKVWLGFWHSTSQTFGANHLILLERGIGGFMKYVVVDHPGIFWMMVACVAATVFAMAGRSAREARKDNTERRLYGLAGLYLVIFSGTISFVLGSAVPSRLTFLPSLGLSLLLAYLAFLAFRGASVRGRPLFSMACGTVVAVIVLMCLAEAVAFSGIIKIRENARACDQSIVDQMCAIAPRIPNGSEVYISMQRPVDEAGLWREQDSAFGSGNARGPLWYGYHCGINGIAYFHDLWSVSDPVPTRFSQLIDRYSRGDTGKIYPFFVDGNLKMQAIRSVQLVDAKGNPAGVMTFPSMENAPADRVTSVTARVPAKIQ